MSVVEPSQIRVAGNGLTLNTLLLGNPNNDAVVMLHGMRDTAWALLPIAQALAEDFHVIVPELRGHGASDRSDAYALYNFVLDLHSVAGALTTRPFALFGHSLGGHIAYRYAALYPEDVNSLMIVEGTGPPARNHSETDAAFVMRMREAITNRGIRRDPRPLSNRDEALAKLCANNPRLSPDDAQRIVDKLVTAQGASSAEPETLHWNFDPLTFAAFISESDADNRRYRRQVKAPTCVVSGMLSHEYWSAHIANSGHFAEGEMEKRAAEFADSEHHWFEGSGHMVHYDEPQRLADLCVTFIRRHLPRSLE